MAGSTLTSVLCVNADRILAELAELGCIHLQCCPETPLSVLTNGMEEEDEEGHEYERNT